MYRPQFYSLASALRHRLENGCVNTRPRLSPSQGYVVRLSSTSDTPPPLVTMLRKAIQLRFGSKQLEEGIFCLGQLAAAGHSPAAEEWNALLHCLAVDQRNEPLSSAVLQRMDSIGVESNETTVYLRMLVRLLQNDIDAAADEIGSAAKRGIPVSPKTYAVLVDALSQRGDRSLELAMSIVLEMPSASYSNHALGAVLNGLVKRGQHARAISFFDNARSMRPENTPSTECYNLVLEAKALSALLRLAKNHWHWEARGRDTSKYYYYGGPGCPSRCQVPLAVAPRPG